MKCPQCNADNPDNSAFCGSCGAPLKGDPEGQPTAGSSGQATASGLDENVAALLSYVLGWITGLIFFFWEKDNDFVRYHAMQSIVVFGAFTVVQIILGILGLIPFVGILFAVISYILAAGTFILWIVLMIKAYSGERYRLPVAAEYAERWSKKSA